MGTYKKFLDMLSMIPGCFGATQHIVIEFGNGHRRSAREVFAGINRVSW